MQPIIKMCDIFNNILGLKIVEFFEEKKLFEKNIQNMGRYWKTSIMLK